jgi:tetratricopeptide (TPR) repeat protein
MEVTNAQTHRELHAPYTPPLLEAPSARESQLLEAVKLLENRIRQLEHPGAVGTPAATIAQSPSAPSSTHANGVSAENGHAAPGEGKVIDVAPVEMQSSATKVSVMLAKGEVLLETERLQEAVNSFTEALTIEPNNAEAHLKKGIGLERMNRLEPALACYNEALRLNPKRSFAYVHKARVLAALHRYDEALSVYDMALGKAPQKATTTTASSTELHRTSAAG